MMSFFPLLLLEFLFLGIGLGEYYIREHQENYLNPNYFHPVYRKGIFEIWRRKGN